MLSINVGTTSLITYIIAGLAAIFTFLGYTFFKTRKENDQLKTDLDIANNEKKLGELHDKVQNSDLIDLVSDDDREHLGGNKP